MPCSDYRVGFWWLRGFTNSGSGSLVAQKTYLFRVPYNGFYMGVSGNRGTLT